MKIIQLTAENVKRLVAVEITPNGAMVQITGKNGQGKTSVLDSIWWAIGGAKNIQVAPIRKGQNQARIRLDMGDIIVTRTFKREGEGDGFTTKLEVVGQVKGSPQAMLDSLLDSLAFDPLKFARMDPKEQFDALKKYVPGVDFDAIAGANSIDMANRKEINRKAKEERIIADQIMIPDKAPTERIDEADLVKQLAEAGKHNADIQMRQSRREQAAVDVRMATEKAERLRQESIRILSEAKKRADALDAEAKQVDAEAKAAQEKISSAEKLPDPINVDDLQAQIEKARTGNRFVDARANKARLMKAAVELEAKAKALTDRMETREAEKQKAVAGAKLPVESITFGDGVVLLNGVPFEQGSDAEQLRASCALAMAGNPQLRVIRVRDGSLLDEESLAIVARMAEERDYQVWIERVGSGNVGFTLEDGHVLVREKEESAKQPELPGVAQ